MDKSTIIAKLREHEGELKAAGIEHLFLYGSRARGTAIRETSDVDVIAEFAPGRRLSLLDMVADMTSSCVAWIWRRQCLRSPPPKLRRAGYNNTNHTHADLCRIRIQRS